MASLLLCCGIASIPAAATAIDLLSPGDPILGGVLVGASFEVGTGGFSPDQNYWPADQSPEELINGQIGGYAEKYLNFAKLNCGAIVTPVAATGGQQTVVTEMELWVAHDAVERDPASYALYGTNAAIAGAGPFALSDFRLIASGPLSLPDTRDNVTDASGFSQVVPITTNFAYTSYLVVFPTVKDAAAANSMQLSELQLRGTIGSVPTIDATARFAWGENIGWTDWRHDAGEPGQGATIGHYYCSGVVWGENVGWIQLGTGAPVNRVHYSNTDASDYGVNHDGAGGLFGLAWGENIGWIRFDQSVSDPPRLDLSTGKFAGYAYGENVGWIDLGSNGAHFVKTNAIDAGPDTDSDMIADAWEREQAEAAGLGPALTHLEKTTDRDGDGRSDLEEFLADTDPFDPGDYLRVVSFAVDRIAEDITLEWTSSPRRIYEIGSTTALDGFTVDFDNLAPNPGPTTTMMFADPVVEHKFWQVGAKLPLAPPAP